MPSALQQASLQALDIDIWLPIDSMISSKDQEVALAQETELAESDNLQFFELSNGKPNFCDKPSKLASWLLLLTESDYNNWSKVNQLLKNICFYLEIDLAHSDLAVINATEKFTLKPSSILLFDLDIKLATDGVNVRQTYPLQQILQNPQLKQQVMQHVS